MRKPGDCDGEYLECGCVRHLDMAARLAPQSKAFANVGRLRARMLGS